MANQQKTNAMTRDEFIKILPSYMGCEVRMKKGEVGHISEVANNGSITCADTVEAYNDFGDFKLLLRRVDNMTEDEIKELAELVGESPIVFPGILNWPSWSISEATKMINYLRPISVDCDDLLSTEWAELKTNK